jgi:hypothetical protein
MRSLYLLPLAFTVILAGCKATDAMDNTQVMKDDLAQMKNTTSGMSQTTDKMKDSTNELTRLAKVADGKSDLDMSKHNYDFFLPPPAEILAGAKLVSENMTEAELIDYLFIRIKEMNEQVPDQNAQSDSVLGGYTKSYVNRFNNQQMVRGLILQAIAGQIPQSMVEQLISDQIYGSGGARSDVVLQTLKLRAKFLDEFLLNKDAFRKPLTTIEDVRVAYNRISYLKFILNLPFAADIDFKVADTSFLPKWTPAKLKKGDADYDAKCNPQAPPAQPGQPAQPAPQPSADCFPTVTPYYGFSDYAKPLDKGADQQYWQKLDVAINGQAFCDGTRSDPSVRANLLSGNSPYAEELAKIGREARAGYKPDPCN